MTRTFQVGIVGTFDVQNYGDLLFPIIAEHELRQRLGRVEVRPFSYHGRNAREWPYEVTSVTELPGSMSELDALLIGGGYLIRFDKHVADGYGPPNAEIHHPTGYWLTPALMALDRGVPVLWNAPGMHCNDVPAWAAPLLSLALQQSSYIAVRDDPSKEALKEYVDAERINVVPDTAFALASLLPDQPSARFLALRESLQLSDGYVLLQPAMLPQLIEAFPRFCERHRERFNGLSLLATSIGPVLGDYPSLLGEHLRHFKTLPEWPDPLLLAEVISHATAVVGHSYHLAITALTAGVPVFSSADLEAGKYTALRRFESVHSVNDVRIDAPETFFDHLGRRAVSGAMETTLPLVEAHWDRMAAEIQRGWRATQPAFGRFWQTLPSLLENSAASHPTARKVKG